MQITLLVRTNVNHATRLFTKVNMFQLNFRDWTIEIPEQRIAQRACHEGTCNCSLQIRYFSSLRCSSRCTSERW